MSLSPFGTTRKLEKIRNMVHFGTNRYTTLERGKQVKYRSRPARFMIYLTVSRVARRELSPGLDGRQAVADVLEKAHQVP